MGESVGNKSSPSFYHLNLLFGCAKVSEGCKFCYIDRMPWFRAKLRKLAESLGLKAPNPFSGVAYEIDEKAQFEGLSRSVPWNKEVFVMANSDFFGEFITDTPREAILTYPSKNGVDYSYRTRVHGGEEFKGDGDKLREHWLAGMEARPQWQFKLLTKRTQRMAEFFETRKVPRNVWAGTTTESRVRFDERVPFLRKIDAGIRWLSVEPMLENFGEVDLTGIRYIACGGETDPRKRYRPFKVEWAQSLYKQCQDQGVAFWFDGGNGRFDDVDREHYSDLLPQNGPTFERYGAG